MREAPIGTKGTFTHLVTIDDLASRLDSTLPAVMATRVMVGMMELAAMDAIRRYLEPGESSVGVAIEVNHIAATPPGHLVRAEAELAESDGRRLRFNVRAWDQTEEIGSGLHRRAVIDFAKFNQRLAPKLRNS